jgi:hypothetical protein
MASKHEYDRGKTEKGGRVALDIALENWGYGEERLATVPLRPPAPGDRRLDGPL